MKQTNKKTKKGRNGRLYHKCKKGGIRDHRNQDRANIKVSFCPSLLEMGHEFER
jgi:hypothetical protein